MAKCDFCGKGVTFGIQVSHSHRRSNRPWKPNVKRVKAIVNGTPTHVYVCTRCLRSGKVERACHFVTAPSKRGPLAMMKRRTSFASASLSEGGVTESDGGSPHSLAELSG